MKRKPDSTSSVHDENKKSKTETGEIWVQQRMKVDELLNEVKPSTKKSDAVTRFVDKLRSLLFRMKKGKCEHRVSDLSWLKTVQLPLHIHNSVKGTFKFHPSKKVDVIGSFGLETFVRRHENIDVAVEIPKECFQDKDYLNERYFVKRALYLTHLAVILRKSDLVQQLSFSHHHGNHLKPVLLLKPTDHELQHVTVGLHVYAEKSAFKLSRFVVSRNNVRRSWFMSENEQLTATVGSEDAANSDLATPHYNSWILSDLTMQIQHHHIAAALGDSRSLRDGLILLKVWLHQRQLDTGFGCFSGFIAAAFVAYLTMHKHLNASMTCYQVFRKTLIELCNQDWCSSGITMATENWSAAEIANRQSLDDFHSAFDVVFVDTTGYVNLCADMSAAHYRLVRQEAKLSVETMDSASAFEDLFMKPVSFFHKYDQTFQLSRFSTVCSEVIVKLKLESKLLDLCGDYVNTCLPSIISLLYKALGPRVTLIAAKPLPAATWDVTTPAPSGDAVDNLWLGILLDPQQATVIHDLGPYGGSAEAEEFQSFWKEKADLRRFPDGSIREAVVWSSQTAADRRMICSRIVKHILCSHAGILKGDIKCMSNQLDVLLRPTLPSSAAKDDGKHARGSSTVDSLSLYGTGEEQQASIIASCDSLVKLLRSAVSSSTDLPLSITAVHGVSAAFRYSEVFPALPVKNLCRLEKCGHRLVPGSRDNCRCPVLTPAMTVVCLLEGSGKWPESAEAVRRLKAAYCLSLSDALGKTAPDVLSAVYADYLEVYKDGYVFHVIIGCIHEITLTKSWTLPDGRVKLYDGGGVSEIEYQLVTLPRFTSLLHGVHSAHNSYSGAVRLAKRWLASQMLLTDYIEEETVELIVASLYLSPAPFTPPRTPLVGFLRFLKMLSTHDWLKEPLIVNLNNEFTESDCAEIKARFARDRSTLPLMFISSPVDRLSQQWTRRKPTPPLLQRVALLAREAHTVFEHQLQHAAHKSDFKQVFRPSKTTYDLVIELLVSQLAREHCAVDAVPSIVPKFAAYTEPKMPGKQPWPLIGYDPVQIYLRELRAAFDDIALFFYDVYGGNYIGVVWKPSAAATENEIKISHVACRMPEPGAGSDDVQLSVNKEAVIEDFEIIGKGLVSEIITRDQLVSSGAS